MHRNKDHFVLWAGVGTLLSLLLWISFGAWTNGEFESGTTVVQYDNGDVVVNVRR